MPRSAAHFGIHPENTGGWLGGQRGGRRQGHEIKWTWSNVHYRCQVVRLQAFALKILCTLPYV